MSTHADIIVRNPDTGCFASIYCHSDGYLGYTGKNLVAHFTDFDTVCALVSKGGLRGVDETVAASQGYHEWRNEELRITISAELSDHAEMEYSYLFNNGEWFYTTNGNMDNWRSLANNATVDLSTIHVGNANSWAVFNNLLDAANA